MGPLEIFNAAVLERDSQRELQHTRHVCAGGVQEICCAHVRIHTRPLGMVEDVEGLGAELDVQLLDGLKDLVDRRPRESRQDAGATSTRA